MYSVLMVVERFFLVFVVSLIWCVKCWEKYEGVG